MAEGRSGSAEAAAKAIAASARRMICFRNMGKTTKNREQDQCRTNEAARVVSRRMRLSLITGHPDGPVLRAFVYVNPAVVPELRGSRALQRFPVRLKPVLTHPCDRQHIRNLPFRRKIMMTESARRWWYPSAGVSSRVVERRWGIANGRKNIMARFPLLNLRKNRNSPVFSPFPVFSIELAIKRRRYTI